MPETLLIGYGNPGRLDDGLGPALAEAVEKMNIGGVTVDSDYQLTVEDAVTVADHNVVIFADADVGGPEPFYLKKLDPANSTLSFSSHSVSPGALVAMAEELFHKKVKAYILGIRGYEFNEFGERLSDKAKLNLAEATRFIETALTNGGLEEVRAELVSEIKID
jgi:hydrogenase maturation protease